LAISSHWKSHEELKEEIEHPRAHSTRQKKIDTLGFRPHDFRKSSAPLASSFRAGVLRCKDQAKVPPVINVCWSRKTPY
jgi:hypothetical protein